MIDAHPHATPAHGTAAPHGRADGPVPHAARAGQADAPLSPAALAETPGQRPRALVLRAAGTNCDGEMLRAFTLAGAAAESVHLDQLIAQPQRLDDAELIGLPGGFSYGDDIASGRVFALRLRASLYPALRAAAQRGALIIGACNGFQVLVQAGLLPGPPAGTPWPEGGAPEQELALTVNERGRFVDRWLRVDAAGDSVCVWTRGLAERFGAPGGRDDVARDVMMLPIAHGEGRLVARDRHVIDRLGRAGQIALRYAPGFNVNGSEGGIAGVCDATGRIFGLMPHPERYLDWSRHPFWTALQPRGGDGRSTCMAGDTPGLMMFRNAVGAVLAGRR